MANLLEEASILLTPTAYDNGRMLAVKPDENLYGDELVVNGDFATDTDWNKGTGWTIANGSANSNGSGLIYQTSVSYVDGKTYKVTFDANITSGGGTVRLGNTTSTIAFTNGANEFYLQTDASNTTRYIFFQGNSLVGSIDNVSVKEYITATNTPRLDYSTGAEAFLLEPQSTNLITYSELFSDSYWTKIGASVVGGFVSPKGDLSAFKLVENSSNSSHSLQSPFVSGASGADTFSIFAKSDGRFNFSIVEDAYTGINVIVNLQDGTITTTGQQANIISLKNGWYRIDVTRADNSSPSRWLISLLDSSNNASYQGDGTSGVYIFGAQLEVGSYATSYIPTSGATATRNQELCNNATPVINSEEGTFYFEGSALDDDGTDRKITLSDGSLNNVINFGFSRFNGNINAEVISGGVLQTSGFGATGIAQDNNNKFALSWGGGVSKFYVNGTLASSYTNVTSPIGMNVLNFSLSSGFQRMFSNTKDLRVYPKALADVQLQDLTTL